MANLKIVADNAADRAVISADTTAGTLVATNVQADSKGTVHRATGKTVAYSLLFPSPEQVACAAVLGNFSPTATMRVRATSEGAMTNLLASPEDFSSSSWIYSNMTVATGVTDPSGSNKAATLTANSGGFVQFRQVLTNSAAALYTGSVWLRRRTGTGTVNLWSADNSAAARITDLPTTWTRYQATTKNPTIARALMIEMTTVGDQIDIAFPQLQVGAVADSYYPGTRPAGYMDTWQAYTLDSGAIAACSAPAPKLRGLTPLQAASAYAFGGGAYASVWFNSLAATGMRIEISDPNNLQGYVEAWRLIVGDAWSPKYNPDWGAGVTPTDASKSARMESGDSVTSQGARGRKLSLPLKGMPATDRAALFDILRANGTGWPMLVSLFPGDADKALERDHMLWAKLSTLSAMVAQAWSQFNSSLEFDEA